MENHVIDIVWRNFDHDTWSLLIAYDIDGVQAEDVLIHQEELKELLYTEGYICDYNAFDVAVEAEWFGTKRKMWCDFSRFMTDEMSDQLCINLLTSKITSNVK
ncbi:hypothetical protein DCC81_24680 [Chitinophaga parva]|uniref:Uncharacterized protein n=1 Tax=Chitinophaga parva TaxID=2169414 RepID=A0A2T7BBN6_9BACT|nr:hypothetical protein [Chitinophaga parva]PUZ21787.1 hypothetical protein DCC81_24680 [Chitinophaga parva]